MELNHLDQAGHAFIVFNDARRKNDCFITSVQDDNLSQLIIWMGTFVSFYHLRVSILPPFLSFHQFCQIMHWLKEGMIEQRASLEGYRANFMMAYLLYCSSFLCPFALCFVL